MKIDPPLTETDDFTALSLILDWKTQLLLEAFYIRNALSVQIEDEDPPRRPSRPYRNKLKEMRELLVHCRSLRTGSGFERTYSLDF